MADVTSRSELVAALADEFAERFRRGERPPISEYVNRCPEAELEIREVLSALAHVERLAPSSQEEGALHEPHATELPHLHQLGDFRIIREVGRGGMGVVYEAEQVSLGRRVALKVLPRQTLLDSKHAKRFEREARAAAKLHHTNIVPVFGVGSQEGLHYYVMQFIHGLGLDEVLVELKRLREASEFPHATAEQQIASVVAAGAAEKAAVGVQALACGGQPEGWTPTGRDVSAFSVAQSLVSGQFERTLIVESSEESDVSGQPSGSSTPTLPATTLHSPHSTLHTPPDTAVGRLSETAAGSGAYALPGQSEAHRKAHSRSVYWQSVARIGVQAAEALQYAHDQGVIHRDVKPGNLLLDTRGSVWVTDFGLAKATDQQDLTHTGDVLGTLRYMAPEQFDGKADARSDVYALGLTLYELLALQPGFDEKDRHKLIKQVTTGAPARLRTVDAHIPRDLETIVHKAIERDAAQRYQSAGELAADVQRYLGDEPIRARRISPVTRFARWCKRNPAVAGLTMTIALLLVAAVAISSIAAVEFEGLAADNGKLAAQAIADKHTAVAAQNEAETARDRERELRDEADAQKLLAQANFARALEAVNTYLDEITDTELLSVPGLQPLREQLLSGALRFYAEFTEERTDDPELLIELADAHYRLGRIYAELGDANAARTANSAAIRLFEQLRDRQPDDLNVRSGLAHAYARAGRRDDTVNLCQSILKIEPQNAKIRSLLADTYNALANHANKDDNDVATALAYHQQAFKLREALVREFPDDAACLAELGGTVNNIGVLLAKQNRSPEALQMFELAVGYSARAYELQPHSILWGEWLCLGIRNCAYKQKNAGLREEARQSFGRLVTLRRDLALRNQAVTRLQAEVYRACLEQSRYEQQLGNTVASSRAMREARRILELIPHDTAAQQAELAVMYSSLSLPVEGGVDETAFDPEEQADFRELAVTMLKEAIDSGYRDLSALQQDKLLDPLREREDFREMIATLERVHEAERLANNETGTDAQKLAGRTEAARILRELIDEQPANLRHRQTLAATLHSIGVIQTGLKQFDEAEQSLNTALQLRQELLSERDDDPQARLDVLSTRAALGQRLWTKRDYSQAHAVWKECLAELRQLGGNVGPQGKALLQRISAEERAIHERYAQSGLIEDATEFISRYVGYESVDAYAKDMFRFPVLLALDRDFDGFRLYVQDFYGRSEATDPGSVLWLATMSPESGLSVEQSTSLAERFTDLGVDYWSRFLAATAEYRAGRFQQALEQMEASGIGDKAWYRDYWRALMLEKAGRHGEAVEWLERAEGDYRSYVTEGLTHERVGVSVSWFFLAYTQILRREAWSEIRGLDVSDPWHHLIQARAYLRIGERAKADQELAAAAAAAPESADVWIARARLLDQWDATEENWREVMELAGDDPLIWIERGRAYAERGEHQSAEDAYSRAALLTDSLNPFLDGGWRAVGPITPAMASNRDALVLSASADPTQPVVISGATSPLEWKPLPPEPHGHIALDPVDSAQLGAWYAAGNVYCRNPREADLLLAGTGRVIIWVNGEQIVPETSLVGAEFPAHVRQRVQLKAGRNTILVRLVRHAGNRSVFVRFPESTLDRAIDFAEAGLFADAIELFETGLQTPPFSEHPWEVFAAALRAERDDEQQYARLCERIVERYGDTTHPPAASVVALAAGMTSARVVPPARLVELAELQLSLSPSDPARIHVLAMALYRAERYADARTRLQNAIDVERYPQCWPLLALTLDRLGDREGAGVRLTRAHEWYSETLDRLAAGASAKPAGWEPFVVLLREAAQQIEGKPLANDLRLHLWRARSWSGFGEFERAMGEMDAALALAPGDSDIATVRARLLTEWDDADRSAEAAWQRAIELAGNDPLPRIHFGRWYAERGEHEKADALFAEAAALTPDELNKFLEAGWWVVGPYPPNLDEFCPPEIDPDPSRPVYVIDPQSGLSDQPVPWKYVPTGRLGFVRMGDVLSASGASAYALAYVYSPQEGTRLLRVGNARGIRIWCNGRLIFRADNALKGNQILGDRVPVSLQSGRNVILLRTGLDAPISLRVADTPADRFLAFAEQGLWKEAADAAFIDERSVFGEPIQDQGYFASIQTALLAGDEQILDREGQRLLSMALGGLNGLAGRWNRVRAAETVLVLDNLPAREHAGDLQAVLTELLGETNGNQSMYKQCLELLARCAVLLGEIDAAREHLTQLGEGSDSVAPVWSIIHEREGRHDEAVVALDGYLQQAESAEDIYWPSFVSRLLTLRAVEFQITGSTERTDRIIAERRQAALGDWESRDAATAAFDHLVSTCFRLGANGDASVAYLARGKRLAELGRFDDAEADFDKAVELAPDDIDVLVARATFLADCGQVDQSADEFRDALFRAGVGPAGDYWKGLPVYGEVALRDDVLDRLEALRPDDTHPRKFRMILRVHRGELEAAMADAERLEQFAWHRGNCAAVALLAGDDRKFADLLASRGDLDPMAQSTLLKLAPSDVALGEELLAIVQEHSGSDPNDRWYRRWLGEAQFRAGQLEAAVATLEGSQHWGFDWQCDGCYWPLLAMAHHRLGNADLGQKYLDKTRFLLDLYWQTPTARFADIASHRVANPHTWLETVVYYREAMRLIAGPEAAAAELARLTAPPVEIAAPRPSLEERLAESYNRAEAAWQRAVDLAGDDPLPRIQFGRWYAERGEHEKADAQFAAAAALTPNELNKFLEAGWWVVGPYPPNLDEFCPPEVDPDPSKPVYVIDPLTGLSDAPAEWRNVATGPTRSVDLTGLFGRSALHTHYALTYLYSPADQTVILVAPRDQPLRLWVNGRFAEQHTPATPPMHPWYAGRRIPIALRAGRNQILVKTGTPSFWLHMATTPLDQALFLAEQDRFQAAGELLASRIEPALDELRVGVSFQKLMTFFPLALLEDGTAYERACTELMRQFKATSDAGTRAWITWAVTLRPNAAFDAHADECIQAAEAFVPQRPGYEDFLLISALANYRAAKYETASRWAEQAERHVYRLPLRALIAHQLQDTGSAKSFLEEAQRALDAQLGELKRQTDASRPQSSQQRAFWWYERFALVALLQEAEAAISPGQPTSRSRVLDTEQALGQWWAGLNETLAFDHAVCTTATDDSQTIDFPQPFLARARRLAELGRFDEAEADFNRAVELAPADRDVLIARARFHARRGDAEQAAADIVAAFKVSRDQNLGHYPWCNQIDLEFLQDPAITERLAELQPNRASMVSARLFLRGPNGDPADTAADIAKLRALGRLDDAGCHALLHGDRDAYEEICREAVETDFDLGGRLWLLLLGEPSCTTPADLLVLAEQVLIAANGSARGRQFLGIALYRAGQYEAAAATLAAATDRSDSWQHDVPCWPVLAMAHHRLGHPEEARKWLDRTAWYLDLHHRNGLQPHAFGLRNVLLGEYATTVLAYREATALIESRTPQTEPPPNETE